MHIKHHLSSGEAVQFLQEQLKQEIHYYDLDNLIRAGAIEAPELIAGRRMWSPENLKEAAKALKVRRAKRPVLTSKRSLINKNNQ